MLESLQKKKVEDSPLPFNKMSFEQQMTRLFSILPSSETGEQVKTSKDSTVADAVLPKPEKPKKAK